MEFKLKVLDGKHAGQEIPVPGNKFFIGRAEDCQLRPGSDLVSRHHCVLVVEDGYAGVRDLGSKNGTFVNAEAVCGERELHCGDRLKVGPLEFEVVLSTGVGGKKKPAVTGGIKEAATRAANVTATAGDINVADWIGPPSDEPTRAVPVTPPAIPQRPAASTDTEEIDIGSTREVVLADLVDGQARTDGQGPTDEQAVAVESKTAVGKTDPKAKKPPGKLPFQPPRVVAKDSRDAAAQILDKMRKRR